MGFLRKEKICSSSPSEHRIVAIDGQAVHVASTGVTVKYQGENQIFKLRAVSPTYLPKLFPILSDNIIKFSRNF